MKDESSVRQSRVAGIDALFLMPLKTVLHDKIWGRRELNTCSMFLVLHN